LQLSGGGGYFFFLGEPSTSSPIMTDHCLGFALCASWFRTNIAAPPSWNPFPTLSHLLCATLQWDASHHPFVFARSWLVYGRRFLCHIEFGCGQYIDLLFVNKRLMHSNFTLPLIDSPLFTQCVSPIWYGQIFAVTAAHPSLGGIWWGICLLVEHYARLAGTLHVAGCVWSSCQTARASLEATGCFMFGW